jgi:pimeloyl-ACP methyl ester carboxylesterase
MPIDPRVDASAAFHRSMKRVTRLFGGRHGQLPVAPLLPPNELDVHLGNVRLHALEWPGPGPTLLLLHGLNNNAWSWARVASLLSPSRRVLALCLRGHGTSSAPASGYTLQDTSRDMLGVLDALGLDAIDLAGHSWGGKVATHFACTHPERVRALALADPVLPGGLNRLIRTFPPLITASLRAERGPFPDQASWEAAGRSLIYLHHWDEVDRKLWSEAFRRTEDGAYHHVLPEAAFEEILGSALRQDISDLLSTLRIPVLLMRPTFTLSFLPGELRPLRKALPHLVEKRIAGDHTFIHTNPLDTVDTLQTFLF